MFLFADLQGMGNFVNGCVILMLMAWFGMTGAVLDPIASRNVVMIQFAVAAAVSMFMVLWRWFKLKESEVRGKQDNSSSMSAAANWVLPVEVHGAAEVAPSEGSEEIFCSLQHHQWQRQRHRHMSKEQRFES
jgi:hypothetical protein